MSVSTDVDERLTVVFVFLDFDDGGAQRLALTTWRRLDPDRYGVVLVCVRSRGQLVPAAEALGIPALVLGRLTHPFDIRSVSVIARELRRLEADIVHVPLYSRVSPYARAAAKLASVDLTVAHEHCRGRPPTRRRRCVDRLLMRGTKFVAVSEAQRSELVCQGVSPDSIAVIGNGVDVERFCPGDRGRAREQLQLEPGRPTVVVPARLVPRKGHVDLVAALLQLKSTVPDLLVLCAGGGPLRKKLPALAESAGVGSSIRFLGHRDDIPVLLAAADAVCLPSHVEGMPLAILEAMAAGRAVVATRVDGVPEVVADTTTGLLVPARAPGELARAIAALLTDEEMRGRMERAARRIAVERHRDVDMVLRLQSAYETWLADRRLPPAPSVPR